MDLPTIQMLDYETGAVIRPVGERWISVADGQVRAVAEELLLAPYESLRVHDRVDRAESLKSDPVALGTIGSLSLGFIAAAVFAAVGFSVSAIVSARERITEFALLRAVGLSSRQLAAWLTLEHGLLVVISLVFGSFIGLLLAWLILPLISITQEATTAIPEVIVVYPWNTIVRLELSLIVVLSVIVAFLATVLRRLGLGSTLRLGED
jgi:ABC-type antimicrobial peptide transport system permease subunit